MAGGDGNRSLIPKGDPVVLLLMIAAIVPSALLGAALGAGGVTVVGALVALFALIAFLGGPLRSDIRLAAVLAPFLLAAGVVPRLLSEVSQPAGIAAVVAIVFVGALLPILGPRFDSVAQGIGMVTLFAYGAAVTGSFEPHQLVLAVIAGLIVAFALRVLFGLSDPRKETRAAIAGVLDRQSPMTAGAFDTWVNDGAPVWLGEALEGAVRYRVAAQEAASVARVRGDAGALATLDVLSERAESLAEQMRAKGEATRAGAPAPVLDADAPASIQSAEAGLDMVAAALGHRDGESAHLTRAQRAAIRVARRPAVRPRSIQLRHAIRTAIGILVMLVLAAMLRPGDPLVATVLLAAFGILQASWKQSLAKAWPRLVGVLVGAALVYVVFLTVPPGWLLPLSLVALVVGLWYMTAAPAIGYGCMVLVTVGLNVSTRHLDPTGTLLEYTALMMAAVLVATVVGFAVVPALRPLPLTARVERAWEATGAALDAMRAGAEPMEAKPARAIREAAAARAELVLDDADEQPAKSAALEQYRTALADLMIIGIRSATKEPIMTVLARDFRQGPYRASEVRSDVPARDHSGELDPESLDHQALIAELLREAREAASALRSNQ